jgi:hypothetical protein
MSLTDAQYRSLRSVYRERLIPAAERLRAEGVSFYAAGPDGDAMSYYVPRVDDGDYVTSFDSASLAQELRRTWSADELGPLAELAEPLATLAEELRASSEQADDVSPFIYAMF